MRSVFAGVGGVATNVVTAIRFYVSPVQHLFTPCSTLSVFGLATAKQVRIFSGKITSEGIKDFYTTLLIKTKTDPNDELIPEGTARVIKDGNGMASKRSTFRKGAAKLVRKDESGK